MLILASKSPRRKALLEMMNLDFKVIESNYDESQAPELVPENLVEFLACQKALSVFKNNNEDIVIGADTIVVVKDEILGKPKDLKEAHDMIELLQGKVHRVISAVCIMSKNKSISFIDESLVEFYPMSEKEINSYINTKEGLDKAGAYAIQGLGAKYIKQITGDFYSIMGLPIAKLLKELREFGME